MKLCILSDATSLHIAEWAQFLTKRGHEVAIITDNPSDIEGVTIYQFSKYETAFHIPILSAFYQIIRKIFAIRKLIQTIQPDIIHAHYANIYGFLGSFSGFHPQILTCHGSDLLVHPERSKIERYFVKRALKYTDRITLPSREMYQKSIDLGADPGKITVIQYGIDLQLFHYSKEDKQKFRFLSTRALSQMYRTDFIIEAFSLVVKKYTDALLDIVGNGPERIKLEQLVIAKSMKNNVTFWGGINHSEIVKFYQQSSFYITASPTDGLSISLLEAFATGVYPIVPDNKSNRSLKELGFNLKLYALDSVENLSEAIQNLLENSDDLPEKCFRNRTLVEKYFNREQNFAIIESAYRNMLNNIKT